MNPAGAGGHRTGPAGRSAASSPAAAAPVAEGKAPAAAGGPDWAALADRPQPGSGDPAPVAPKARTRSPQPRTTKTRPRFKAPGFDEVRNAIPRTVAGPRGLLFEDLHNTINELLTGSAEAAGVPKRSVSEIVARINRRWHRVGGEERAARGYVGCDRCTKAGCDAPRSTRDGEEGCDRILSPSKYLAIALRAQECPNFSCEDGLISGTTSPCRDCQRRAGEWLRAEEREQARIDAATAWLIGEEEARTAAASVLDAWADANAAEESRIRQVFTANGKFGALLEHLVRKHMAGWCSRNPQPEAAPRPVPVPRQAGHADDDAPEPVPAGEDGPADCCGATEDPAPADVEAAWAALDPEAPADQHDTVPAADDDPDRAYRPGSGPPPSLRKWRADREAAKVAAAR